MDMTTPATLSVRLPPRALLTCLRFAHSSRIAWRVPRQRAAASVLSAIRCSVHARKLPATGATGQAPRLPSPCWWNIPTRADHRASLLFTLTARDKPATDRDFASWARSHRMSIEEVREMWAGLWRGVRRPSARALQGDLCRSAVALGKLGQVSRPARGLAPKGDRLPTSITTRRRRTDIQRMPVADLAAPDCVLFMWATWPMLPEALDTIAAWGFEYKTCAFSWIKADARQTEFFQDDVTPYMGLGYWTRANSEVCLLATRGKPKRLNADVRQALSSPAASIAASRTAFPPASSA
jgi:hypothetical protein